MWCAVLFPSLPLDVFARASPSRDAPFAVTSGGHPPQVIVANGAARRAGVRAGQLVSAALAIAPEIGLRERDSAQEAAALEQIATFALGFTPMVALTPPDAIVAEVGPTARLFGGLGALRQALAGGVAGLGYPASLALAPTPAAALAFARSGAPDLHDRAALPDALAPLPLAHFEIANDACAALASAGVRTFGEARALPRAGLARRFGPALVASLDRALGEAGDPRIPFAPPPRFEAKLELPAPIEDSEALGFAVNRLVRDLADWLLARGLGVLRLSLTLLHERSRMRDPHPRATQVGLALGAATRTPPHLSTVLRERLARLALPAPVEGIVLTSLATSPLQGRDLPLLPGGRGVAAEVPVIDRLRARLGDEAVAHVAAFAEHRPERAHADHRDEHPSLGSPLPVAPRPVWLLPEPQPLGTLPEERAWILRDGPERIESGWWDGGDIGRDYFVAETPHGELLWIFRDHRRGTSDGEWFVHGRFA